MSTFNEIIAESEATREAVYTVQGLPFLTTYPEWDETPQEEGQSESEWGQAKRAEQAKRAVKLAKLISQGKNLDGALVIIGPPRELVGEGVGK